ncbi:hypothetical protein Tco_0535852 [Tanacetum coccineum]
MGYHLKTFFFEGDDGNVTLTSVLDVQLLKQCAQVASTYVLAKAYKKAKEVVDAGGTNTPGRSDCSFLNQLAFSKIMNKYDKVKVAKLLAVIRCTGGTDLARAGCSYSSSSSSSS